MDDYTVASDKDGLLVTRRHSTGSLAFWAYGRLKRQNSTDYVEMVIIPWDVVVEEAEKNAPFKVREALRESTLMGRD